VVNFVWSHAGGLMSRGDQIADYGPDFKELGVIGCVCAIPFLRKSWKLIIV
jgi:hypothetical protein